MLLDVLMKTSKFLIKYLSPFSLAEEMLSYIFFKSVYPTSTRWCWGHSLRSHTIFILYMPQFANSSVCREISWRSGLLGSHCQSATCALWLDTKQAFWWKRQPGLGLGHEIMLYFRHVTWVNPPKWTLQTHIDTIEQRRNTTIMQIGYL